MVSLGDRKRLLRAAVRMLAAMSGTAADPVAVPPAPSAGAACAGELDDGGERHHAEPPAGERRAAFEAGDAGAQRGEQGRPVHRGGGPHVRFMF